MKKIIFLLMLFMANLFAINLDQHISNKELFSSSQIWITSNQTTINEALYAKEFQNYEKTHINLGFNSHVAVWVKLEFHNLENREIQKIIKVDNPLLEHVVFFEKSDGYKAHKKGMLNIEKDQQYIYPTYELNLFAKESKIIYLKVSNKTTSLQFGVSLLEKKIIDTNERVEQLSIIFFIGMLSAFFIYSLTLFFYTKNVSYFLYASYLFFLMFQQLTFIGFLPLFATKSFTYIDNLLVVPKVSMMIITAALFAKNFLKTQKFPRLNKIYNVFIIVLLIQMPLLGTQWFYLPEFTIALGFLFVVFNTICGMYVYFKGNKQARFFILGWMFLIFGYLIMIFDSLGFVSIMYNFPELILWLTVFEALFLLLAFVDKISILNAQKKELDRKFLKEITNRNIVIEEEVKEKTSELRIALKDKSMLLQEIHHRVKNNLQLILSIARLQKNNIQDTNELEQFAKLEKRVNSIAKTHEMLCSSDDIAQVDMNMYIRELCDEIQESFSIENIAIKYKIETLLPINKAVYVGLIINELITNSIKYAFDSNEGQIYIYLYEKEGNCILEICDDGKGYDEKLTSNKTLGLKLVKSLAIGQLDGSIKMDLENKTKYYIRFPIKDNVS